MEESHLEHEQTEEPQQTAAVDSAEAVESSTSGLLAASLKRSASDGGQGSRDKRPRLDSDKQGISALPASSRVIVPTELSHERPKPIAAADHDPDATDEEIDLPPRLALAHATVVVPDPPILSETYEVLPPAQRVNPAATLGELLIRNQAISSSATSQQHELQDLSGYRNDFDDYAFDYLPAPLAQSAPVASTSTTIDLTDAPSPPSPSLLSEPLPSPPSGSLGSTLTSAILIRDSPTPPLRPLASPKARLQASASGRCNVFAGEEDAKGSADSPEKEEAKITIGELVCPICLGPPMPLVFSECGHAL